MKYIKNWTVEREHKASDGSVAVIYKAGAYSVVVSEADYMPGGYKFSAYPIDRRDYCPSIYIDAWYDDETPSRMLYQVISIQTTSWGALEISEIDKVIKAYAEAQAVAEEIRAAFPECFKEE